MRRPGNRSLTGAMTACALACWASLTAAQVNPGDPSSSALGASPGASGAVSFGRAPAGTQPVIPVGPGPSYPRVPRGITHPPEPFGARSSNLGIEPLTPLPEARLPLTGQLGIRPGGEPAGPADGLTIDQAIDRVMRLNPELRAQAREISKARADVLTAGLRANPLVYADTSHVPYGSFRGTSGGPTQYDVNITHPIDLNQKRRRRVEAAVRAQEVTEAQYQNAVRLQIDHLDTAWVDVLAARETISLLEAGLKSLGDQKQATEALAKRGAASRSEVNNVEIQLDSTDLTLLEARETHDDAKRTLAALLSLPLEESETFEIRGSLRGPDLPAPPVETLIRTGLEIRPDLAAFRLGILRAQSEVRLARANRLDDVFLIYQPFSVQQGLVPGERSATSWAIGLTVPLPVYNRNQGNIARATHTVAQTEVQLANLERQVILEIQRAEAAYEVTLATIKRLEAEILPAARENLEISLRQSRSEKPDPLAIIEAQRAFGDISRQYLEALIRHRRSMYRLNTAVGCRIFP
jgi:outer membrane protein, heavy metal efflux system